MALRRMVKGEGGMLRQYIPARLEDNPSMAQDDPGYDGRLEGLGSSALVKAMRWGDWDIIDGAFFDCWDKERHVVRPFEVPKHWTRTMSGDWGSAKPFSFGWWAVASDKFQLENGMWLPRGCLVRYREWYGCKKDEAGVSIPDTGLKLHAFAVGEELEKIEKPMGIRPSDRVLDPAAFAENGGPSISEEISRGSGNKIFFRGADNKRVPAQGALGGWDQMRSRLVGDTDGLPMIVCFSTCTDSVRTIPALQHDKNRPEDLDSAMEDHAADDWRYECMSRPWVTQKPEEKKQTNDYKGSRPPQDNDWKAA